MKKFTKRTKMKTKVFFFSAIVTLLLATGCSMHVIQGDGNLVTEQVAIGDYYEIVGEWADELEKEEA